MDAAVLLRVDRIQLRANGSLMEQVVPSRSVPTGCIGYVLADRQEMAERHSEMRELSMIVMFCFVVVCAVAVVIFHARSR